MKHRRLLASFPVLALAVACSTSAVPEDEEVGSSEDAFSSCAESPPDGAGMVWLNFRTDEIGCPNEVWVNPSVRAPAFYNGFLVQGRIRCGYEWLRNNRPDVFAALGNVSSGETHYFSPDGFDAWYNNFDTGGKIQFEWRGPCQDHGHGFFKVYYKARSEKPIGASCSAHSECRSGNCSETLKRCAENCGLDPNGKLVDPGKCSCGQHRTMQDAVNSKCKNPPPPSCVQGERCDTMRFKRAQILACAVSRDSINAVCFENAHLGHTQASSQEYARIGECDRYLSPTWRPACRP